MGYHSKFRADKIPVHIYHLLTSGAAACCGARPWVLHVVTAGCPLCSALAMGDRVFFGLKMNFSPRETSILLSPERRMSHLASEGDCFSGPSRIISRRNFRGGNLKKFPAHVTARLKSPRWPKAVMGQNGHSSVSSCDTQALPRRTAGTGAQEGNCTALLRLPIALRFDDLTLLVRSRFLLCWEFHSALNKLLGRQILS